MTRSYTIKIERSIEVAEMAKMLHTTRDCSSWLRSITFSEQFQTLRRALEYNEPIIIQWVPDELDDTDHTPLLREADFISALSQMAGEMPEEFVRLTTDWDAELADFFCQYLCFGEIRYD